MNKNMYAPLNENEFNTLVEEIQNIYGDYRLNNSYVMERIRDIAVDPMAVNRTGGLTNAQLMQEFLLNTFTHPRMSVEATENAYRAMGRENEIIV